MNARLEIASRILAGWAAGGSEDLLDRADAEQALVIADALIAAARETEPAVSGGRWGG